MHIADGILSPAVALGAGLLAAVPVLWSLREIRRDENRAASDIPMLALAAAFIFAAQMVNFPAAPGVSGHLAGGALAALLFGPWRGSLVLFVVLLIQALLHADGGLLAIGANTLNLGVVPGLVAVVGYRLVAGRGNSTGRRVAAVALSAWAGLTLASVVAFIMISLSGYEGLQLGSLFATLTGVHMLIGVGEAVITVAVYEAVGRRVRVASTSGQGLPPASRRQFGYAALALTMLIAAVVSYFASAFPDGFEHSLEASNIEAVHPAIAYDAPLPDYTLGALEDSAFLSHALAGLAGTVVVFGLVWLLQHLLGKRKTAA